MSPRYCVLPVFLALSFLLIRTDAHAQTVLGAGDVVFTAYNADNTGAPSGTGVDAFSFLLLVDVAAGTTLTFTDNGWLAAGGFRGGEGTLVWTADVPLDAFTQVTISRDPFAASVGSLGGSGLNLSASGDQLFAYQGAAPTQGDDPAFVAALQMNGDWDADATSSGTTARPAALTDGAHAMALSPEVDNAAYDCAVVSGTADAVRAAVWTPANWATDNTTPFGQPRCVFTGPTLPIELARLDARVDGDGVQLVWRTLTETQNAGFEVQHRAVDVQHALDWRPAGFVPGAGTTTAPRNYRFRVDRLDPGVHAFRLRQVDHDGGASLSRTVTVRVELAERVRLDGPFPNPATDRVGVRLAVARAQPVRAVLYDVRGRRTPVQADGFWPEHTLREIVLPTAGLAAGVYVLRLTGETFAETRTVVLRE